MCISQRLGVPVAGDVQRNLDQRFVKGSTLSFRLPQRVQVLLKILPAIAAAYLFLLSINHNTTRAAAIGEIIQIAEAIKKAYDTYKFLSGVLSSDDELTLEEALKAIHDDLLVIQDQRITNDINGLQFTFSRFADNPSDVTAEAFLVRSDAIRAYINAAINTIDLSQDYPGDWTPIHRGHDLALPYNTLVAITAVVMRYVGYSKQIIDQTLFVPAHTTNGKILGRHSCLSQRLPDGSLNLRDIIYRPSDGIVFHSHRDIRKHPNYPGSLSGILSLGSFTLVPMKWVIDNYKKQEIVKAITESDEFIVEQLIGRCIERVYPYPEFEWISDWPRYYTWYSHGDSENSSNIVSLIGSKRDCIQVIEPNDELHVRWESNYLCVDVAFGMRWSDKGDVADMSCINWYEPNEDYGETWGDNYLCFPDNIAQFYEFVWSHNGKPDSMKCLQIHEKYEDQTRTWDDNFFCYRIRGQKG